MKRTKSQIVFQIFNTIIILLILVSIIAPIMHIISVSISNRDEVLGLSIGIFPKGFSLDAYKEVIEYNLFFTSLKNSLIVTVAYIILGILVNVMCAYALSNEFYGKKIINYYFILAMYFSGGLIPTYILITNYLKLYNTYTAMVLPLVVNVFYIIVIKSQIEAIPKELNEAAIIDGAHEFQALFKVVIPIIKPTIAAIAMFLALGMWNMWYQCMLYTNRDNMWTLQYFLRMLVLSKIVGTNTDLSLALRESDLAPENFQMAAIVLVAAPIVAIYPFVQKYFVKGILVGSVKG